MTLTRLDYYRYLFYVYGLGQGTITKSWHGPNRVDLSSLEAPPGEGAYPIDFSHDITPNLLTDEHGIPLIDYANLGVHYNPWFVGHIGLGYYTRWRRMRRIQDRDEFLKLANWLFVNASPADVGVHWLYHFDWFGHCAPWFSGLSQAHAISVLIRAARMIKMTQYIDLARQAVDCMIAPITKGGTATTVSDGSVCFQESRNPPTYILNGHLFSCFALWEAARFLEDDRYGKIAHLGFRFVKHRLSDYDLGYWSCYSLKRVAGMFPDIASLHYHEVHAAQLEIAHALTGADTFGKFARRFRRYQKSRSHVRKALWAKRLIKVIS